MCYHNIVKYHHFGTYIYKQFNNFINNRKEVKNMSQRLTVTLDDETYSYLKEQAERDYRTIGAEICYLLHLHVPAPTSAPGEFIKPTYTPENPTGAPILTNDTTAYYKKRKELI